MKKILIVFLTLFLVSCTSKYKNLQLSIGGNNSNSMYEVFEVQAGIPYPTYIDLFVGDNNEYIGFIYCIGIEDPKNPDYYAVNSIPYAASDGTPYVYYGHMNKVARNLYAVDGTFYLPSMKRCDNKIADDIDFYVYIKDNKVYFIFEKIDNYKDINNYINDYFEYKTIN